MASGDTLIQWTPQANEPPASNYATLDTRNNHPVLDFALNEIGMFSGVLPRHYNGGGITVYMHYAMSSAVANDIKLTTQIERIGDQQQDVDSDGFGPAQSTPDTTVPGTSGLVDVISVAHAHGSLMDNLAAGEGFRLKIERDPVAGTDATGDLELRFIEIKET
jgi:hypothetical protein